MYNKMANATPNTGPTCFVIERSPSFEIIVATTAANGNKIAVIVNPKIAGVKASPEKNPTEGWED